MFTIDAHGIERRITGTVAGSGAAANRAKAPGPGKVAGYAAVFWVQGDPRTEYELAPGIVERIAPGAFKRAIREDDVRLLYNHDPTLLLGRTTARTLRLHEDATGLWYEGDLPDTSTGRDVRQLLARGDLNGSSFGFIVERDDWDREGSLVVRTIRAVRLADVGPVTFPAYLGASSSGGDAGVGRSWPAFDDAEAERARARNRNLDLADRVVGR